MALHVGKFLHDAEDVADTVWVKDRLSETAFEAATVRVGCAAFTPPSGRWLLDELAVLRDHIATLESETRWMELNAGIRAAHADVLETLAWLTAEPV